jgi:O-antigen/teichoic acid export membrane protein
VAVIIQRAVTRRFARRRRPELFVMKGKWNREVLKGMPSLALRAWLTAVGGILVFNTDQFFIASAQGAEEIPAYRAAYLLVLNLNMVAITLAGSSIVFVSQLWQAGEIAALHRIVQRNLRLGLLIMLCGSACLLALGATLFDVWIGPGKFIGYPTLIVFLILLTSETHTFIMVTSSRATEHEAFAASAMTAGILKLALSWWLMQRYGLLGIAAGTAIASLLTNHWYMVFHSFRRLRMSMREHLARVLLPSLGVFLAVLAIDWAVLSAMPSATGLVRVLAVGFTTAILLGASCWWLVLSKHERGRLLSVAGLNNRLATPSKA